MPHISIKAEPLFRLFGFPITNSYLSSIIVLGLFFILCLYFRTQFTLPLAKRSRFFFLILFINKSLYNFFSSILGPKIDILFPVVSSLFIYILIQNWFGLIPGVGSLLIASVPIFRGGTADINATLALGLFSVIITQYYGVYFLGLRQYLHKFFNFSNPIALFTGFLEIISEFSKIISFTFRLFGNIFAGEVLLTIVAFLVPVLASFPFLVLEIFVGFVQALVFSMLTAVFINMATIEHH